MQGRLICTILLLLSLHSGAIQAKANVSIDIAVGLENFDFQPLFEEFSAQTGIKINILAFNNNQLKSELLQYADAMQLPDAVIIPSDYMACLNYGFQLYRQVGLQINSHCASKTRVKWAE